MSTLARKGAYTEWDTLPAVPGLKLRLPLLIGALAAWPACLP